MADKFEVWIEAGQFIHNELSNASHFHAQTAKDKIEASATDGVFFDMMASLVFASFALEANANFVGWKLEGAEWDEEASLKKKINRLASKLGLPNDWETEPLSIVRQLTEVRNTLAHGKPKFISENDVSDVQIDVRSTLNAEWEETIQLGFVEKAEMAIDCLWHSWLEAADISVVDTLSYAGGSSRTHVEVPRSHDP